MALGPRPIFTPYLPSDPNHPFRRRAWCNKTRWETVSKKIEEKIGGIRVCEPKEAVDAWGTLRRAVSVDAGFRKGRKAIFDIEQMDMDAQTEAACELSPVEARFKVFRPYRTEEPLPGLTNREKLEGGTESAQENTNVLSNDEGYEAEDEWSIGNEYETDDEEDTRRPTYRRLNVKKARQVVTRSDGYEADLEDEDGEGDTEDQLDTDLFTPDADKDALDEELREFYRTGIRLVKPRKDDDGYVSPPNLEPYPTKFELIYDPYTPIPVWPPARSSSTSTGGLTTPVTDNPVEMQAHAGQGNVTKTPNDNTANGGSEPRRPNAMMSVMPDGVLGGDDLSSIEL